MCERKGSRLWEVKKLKATSNGMEHVGTVILAGCVTFASRFANVTPYVAYVVFL